MHDSHTHIQDKETLSYLKKHKIKCIVNACTKEEYLFLKQNHYDGMYISCGIHPWYATNQSVSPYIDEASFLGEVGLDKPWCDTPFELQKEVFIKQLTQFNKPTILHTKGYEREVLDIIRLFPRKYLVHWYSSQDYIDEYIELGCFFSIGPSIGIDECVNEVVRKVPITKLVIETDGLDAIKWALGENKDYIEVLNNTAKQVSKIKNLPLEEVKTILDKNFEALTCI